MQGRALRKRAELLATIRRFFAERGVLEVQTPLLYPRVPTDPHQTCLMAIAEPGGGERQLGWLQPSPEFAMKRLLAAGSGSIYQICQAFRAAEAGRLHAVEFTLVEWYRIGLDYRALAAEVRELVRRLLPVAAEQEFSYREACHRFAAVDPVDDGAEALVARLRDAGADYAFDLREADPSLLLDLIWSRLVEPCLPLGAVTIYDYPIGQSALARATPSDSRFAERFELYLDRIELANGYSELTDPITQRQRFEQENRRRVSLAKPARQLDEDLLAALASGLPECAGVALGFDRLLMIALGEERLPALL